ncbi:hypothetical protein NIES267_64740 [Calothrix parasitica NIES-267]|uniref:Uncharacterized protein n=1 Tax=Calothrix parasitica NIES-267 TaxID=1973488 RepID=A0A1Z4M0E7_9CYAN|nr:hypothetical protein NIES267_64740 [Calothrix parasitica NIES-267]
MALEAYFKQVSPDLLEKFQKYPDFFELFDDAQYLPDSPFWQDLSLDLNNSEDAKWFDEATNYVPQTLAKLKVEQPEEFEKLKSDIPTMLAEGKNSEFDIGKKWNNLHLILTGTNYSTPVPSLIGKNKQDKLPSVNAILGGKTIDYETDNGLLRYLTVDEVKQVAQALSKFTQANFKERFASKGLEKGFDNLYDAYKQLQNYYQNVAYQENAMFLYFG